MAKNITLLGADYPDVPAVQLPQTGGGTATYYDIDVIDNLTSTSETDALSAKQGKVLNDKFSSYGLSSNTLANVQNELVTLVSNLDTGTFKDVYFSLTTAAAPFKATTYYGTIKKYASRIICEFQEGDGTGTMIIGCLHSGTVWEWNVLALSSLFDDTQANDVSALMLAKYNLVKNKGVGTYTIAGGWNGVQYGFSIVSIIDSSNAILVFHGNADSWRCKIENNAVINLQRLALNSEITRTELSNNIDFDTLTASSVDKHYYGHTLANASHKPTLSSYGVPYDLDVSKMGAYTLQKMTVYAESGILVFQRQQKYSSGGTFPWTGWEQFASNSKSAKVLSMTLPSTADVFNVALDRATDFVIGIHVKNASGQWLDNNYTVASDGKPIVTVLHSGYMRLNFADYASKDMEILYVSV